MIGRLTRRRARRRARERGFTLIEVMVSLVLLALVLALLTGAVRYARATWDAAARLDREAGYNAAGFVRARLSEAVPLFEQSGTGIVRAAFKGTAESLTFVAPAHNGPAGAGLYRLDLELAHTSAGRGSSALLVRVAPYQAKAERGAVDPPREDHVLAENVKSLAFRYFGRKDLRSTPAWQNEWNRTDALPDLVEMSIAHDNRDSPPPVLVELRLRQKN